MQRRNGDRRGDALSGPPDSSRPRNPWPRLLAFFAVVALAIVLVGVCVVSFASPPPRDLRLQVTEIEPGLPRFLPVIPFGADQNGFTYGAWIAYDGQNAAAYLARHPETRCRLQWDGTARATEQATGAFVDPCGQALYGFDGRALEGTAAKDLDSFPVEVTNREIIVDITRLRLGECREDGARACSPSGARTCSGRRARATSTSCGTCWAPTPRYAPPSPGRTVGRGTSRGTTRRRGGSSTCSSRPTSG